MTYLENLRAKPEYVRKRYAFWSALGVTAIIFVFWLASSTSLGNSARDTVEQAVDRAGTPTQSLVAGVGSFFADIRDLVLGPKQVKYSSVIVTPGDR